MSNIYEIICPEDLQNSIQSLVTKKTSKGYSVHIKVVEDFGNPPDHEAIRNFILQRNPRYYLLVGDYDRMPSYPLSGHSSDAYYGMTDIDKIPQIPFGRLSSNDPTIIEEICNRLANYESGGNGNWTKNVILTGWLPRNSQQFATQSDAGWECVEAIGNHFNIIKRFENNESASGEHIPLARTEWEVENTSKADLIDAINSGALIIRYLGHGTTGSWENIGKKDTNIDEKFNKDDIDTLRVGNKHPFVISAACLTGSITPEIAFGEKWLVDGKAIGVFAADVNTRTYWNDRITQEIFKHVVRKRNITIGEMLVRAMQSHFERHGDRGSEYMKAYTAYRYFGDPDTVLLDLREDKISFNPTSAVVKGIFGRWMIVAGSMRLLYFGTNRNEAAAALNVIKHYNLNQQCFVGRPRASMEYYLVNGVSPQGPIAGEDSIPINPGNIEVQRINNSWKIVDGRMWLLDFGDSEAEARTSYEIIRKYGFRYICFIGRPYPSMTYFRK